MVRALLGIALLASLAACGTPGQVTTTAIPFSVTSNEGTYVDPLLAPSRASTRITSSGIPGDSGESETSSAFK